MLCTQAIIISWCTKGLRYATSTLEYCGTSIQSFMKTLQQCVPCLRLTVSKSIAQEVALATTPACLLTVTKSCVASFMNWLTLMNQCHVTSPLFYNLTGRVTCLADALYEYNILGLCMTLVQKIVGNLLLMQQKREGIQMMMNVNRQFETMCFTGGLQYFGASLEYACFTNTKGQLKACWPF